MNDQVNEWQLWDEVLPGVAQKVKIMTLMLNTGTLPPSVKYHLIDYNGDSNPWYKADVVPQRIVAWRYSS